MSPSGLTVYKDVWLVPAPEAPVERVPAVVADMRFCICRRLKRDEEGGVGGVDHYRQLVFGLDSDLKRRKRVDGLSGGSVLKVGDVFWGRAGCSQKEQ